MKSRATQGAVLLSLVFTALYALTATHAFSYDGLCYALDVDFSSWQNLFHPNHLLYSVIGRGLTYLFAAVGLPLRSILVLQGMNAVVGGVTVGVLFLILERDLAWRRALLGAAALGLSYVFWSEVVDPGCYAWATLAGCGLLTLFLRGENGSGFQTGLFHGVIVLFHQIYILATPALLWRMRRNWAGYLGGVLLIVGGMYAAVAAVLHPGTWIDRLKWTVAPAGAEAGSQLFMWWTFNIRENTTALWRGLVQCLMVSGPGVPLAISFLANGLMLALLGWFIGELMRVSREKNSRRELINVLGVWVALLGIFHFFHLPYASRFWLPVFPTIIYLMLWLTQRYDPRRFYAAAAIGVIVIAMANFNFGIRPQSRFENNPNLVRIGWLSRGLKANDVFVFSGTGPNSIVNVYVAYFLPQVQGRSLRGYFFSHPNGDLGDLNALMQDAHTAGHPVYLEKTLFDAGPQAELERLAGIAPGAVAKWVGQFKGKIERNGPGGYSVIEVR
jgi:hypothetical protein